MNLLETLSAAEALGLTLRVDGESLVVEGPSGAMGAELREAVRENKQGLLAFLHRMDDGAPIVRSAAGTPPTLSAGQERLWFLEQWGGPSARYHVQVALRIQGPLDRDALRRSLDAVVLRHDALRTAFRDVDGAPRGEVMADARPEWREIALAGSAAERDEALLRVTREAGMAPFALDVAPTTRATLVAVGKGDHVLVLTQHHIATDGASIELLVGELTAHYRAFVEHAAPEVAELSIQYSDFAAWQRTRLAGPRGRELASYWSAQLAGVSRLALPSPRPAPPVRTAVGGAHRFTIGRPVVDALKALGRLHDSTLFAGLLASFSTLLHRYSGQTDFGVGTVVAGRERREVTSLLGFFVNTLVLRCDLDGDPSFAELLRRSSGTARAAFEHQEMPFDSVVTELAVERTGELNPLVQAALVLEHAPTKTFDVAGTHWTVSAAAVDGSVEGAAKFDLTLLCVESDAGDAADGIEATLEYSTDLYDAGWIERMARHYVALLGEMVAAPERPISEAEFIDARERTQLLVEWNDTDAPFPEVCVHHLFEQQAARTPSAIAVVCGDEQVTYAELDARANRIAHVLRASGAEPELRIGIALPVSIDRIAAVLAVLKAGAAYLPLDADYPAERLAFMLHDSDARLVVTSDALAPRFDAMATPLFALDREESLVAAQPATPPAPTAGLRNLAYVIYTSGSTGTPKGTLLEHRGLSNLVEVARQTLAMGAGMRVLQFASFTFDASVQEIHSTLISGATLYVAPRDQIHPGPDLAAYIARHRISNVILTASSLSVMEPEQVPGLTVLTTAGEACPEALAAKWAPGRAFFNAYGPTESTVAVTMSPWSDAPPRWTLGRPFANTRLYVLDAHQKLVPTGVTGELCIGGIGLARGYLGRPDLTRASFIPDPFSAAPGARLYRTGDLVRQLPNGEIEYLGRRDGQVKVRGFRIELGEVETAIAAEPNVRAATVVVHADASGDKRLVAYVAGDVDVASLKSALARRLPAHMVPGVIVAMEALPRTSNGKVDRKALPPPGRALAESSYVAPEGRVETALASIFGELLGATRVGVDDSFFDLGGHSLLATRAVSRIRRALGVDLSVRALFESPTIRALAAQFVPRPPSLEPSFPRADRTAPQPASFAQQRLWFLDRLQPGSATYNVPGAFRIAGPLDVDALSLAVADMVARHESLRTTFAEHDGHAVQVIASPTASRSPLVAEDLTVFADAAREEELARRARAEAATPFTLAEGPLLRVRVLRLSPNEHALLLTLHHIVSDGWSVAILLRELGVAYAARAAGTVPCFAPLPVDYADYAALQRAPAQVAASESALRYWATVLAGTTPLDLPLDHPRPARPSQRGDAVAFQLSRSLLTALAEVARARGVTLFMLLVAAYDVLLSRLSGQADITVGTAIANRDRPELESMFGFFVGTVALRADLSDDPSFDALLARVRESTLAAFAHSDVPFERVVQAVESTRDASRTPVFQTMFVLQNAPEAAPALGALTLEPLPFASATAKFDLTWSLRQVGGGLAGDVEYATDLFDRDTVARWCDHFVCLLENIARDPSARVGELALLRADERARILLQGNGAETAPPAVCVHHLFEAQVEASPDAIALVFGEEELTYAALNARANQVAHRLRALGLGRDALVGIALERSTEMVVSALGVLKAGAAYVPLDPAYPSDRLDYMLADSGARALLTTRSVAERFRAHTVPTLLLDEEAEALRRESRENPARAGQPGDLAYAIYTSGSTGRPKGALLEHRGVTAFILGQLPVFGGLGPGRRVLQFASFSFDASVWELFLSLCSGATLYVAHREDILPGADLARFVARHRIDTALLPPSALTVMTPASLASITTLVLAGEACPEPLAARFSTGRRLFNAYGPTEATVYATLDSWSDDAPRWSLGRAVANTNVTILDARDEPVPIGVAGEICVAGIGVGRGYLNQPELTASRFVSNPFSALPARMYRTGDLGRWLPNGDVEYLGRLDHQVKVRGYRIELGEIESLLASAPGVSACAVLAREDVVGDKRIVAYVVGDAEPAALSAELAKKLPSYMVPSAFVPLAEMPLTANGKVDRRALPRPERAALATTFAPPENPTQTLLAQIWRDVVGAARVGVDDSFFELGGHSLLATQVMARIRQAFGVEVPLRALFEAPTIRGLEKAVARASRSVGSPIVSVPRDGTAPLSFAQRRLWVLDQLAPGLSTYNVSAALQLRGPLDVAALGRALDEIVRRHEVLRTTFVETAGETAQVVHPSAGGSLVVENLRPGADMLGRAHAEANVPFSLSKGPLFRARLLHIGATDHLLVVTMHHIVSDGWSIGVLVRELTALYGSFTKGSPSPLAELAVQYADYSAWEATEPASDKATAGVAFWKETLAGCLPLDLPTDRPRPPVQTHRSATARFAVPAPLTRALNDLARDRGATLFMVLVAAYQVFLARMSGQSDVTVGTPIANRQRGEVEPLIGFFVNTLVLRSEVPSDAPFSVFLDRVRDSALAAYAHQETPFERVVQAHGGSRDPSRTPLFQTMMALQNAPSAGLTLDQLSVTPIDLENDTAKFDLTWSLAEGEEGLYGRVEYAAELWDASTIERWLGHFACLLENVVAAPEMSVGDLPLLRGEEARALLVSAGSPALSLSDACIHHLFEAHARRRPDATALVFDGARTTYADLNARANRLAHDLRARAVAPGSLVAIALDSSVERIVALLAVLKAGAAYLPLDPDYPPARLAFTLADSSACLLLTTEGLAPRFADSPTPTVLLDRDADRLASLPATDPPRVTGARDLAYAIYTSGSTGQPKGVLLEHRGLVNLVSTLLASLGIDSKSQVLQFASFAFDASVWDMHTALAAGATLHLGRREELLPGPDLTAFIRRRAITHALLPASALAVMDPTDVPSVTTLATGGEACPESLAEKWATGRRLFNAYGPTEATVCATLAPWSEHTPRWTLGRPIAGTETYLLDARGQLAPVGVAAELCIGGVGLARSYLARPELDREKLIAHPFSREPGARLYRTGDLARRRPDGNLEFLGRIDDQVKIRGHRVELGEIEAALLAHPAVQSAVVLGREDMPGDKRLVAYIVGDALPSASELRDRLAQTLPTFMLPSAFITLEALPITPSGKVDRKALPRPTQVGAGSTPAPPRTEMEQLVARVWREELGATPGRDDQFFDLGGHSLAAVRVTGKLRAALGRTVPVVLLFRDPVLRRFAEQLERLASEETEAAKPALAHVRVQAAKQSAAIKRLGRDLRGSKK